MQLASLSGKALLTWITYRDSAILHLGLLVDFINRVDESQKVSSYLGKLLALKFHVEQ